MVQGVVCRKNLTHRKMRRKIQDARIVMLGNVLEFPRTQGRLASFDHYTKDQVPIPPPWVINVYTHSKVTS